MANPASQQPVTFGDRYEIRRQLWLDGPHGGWIAFDRALRREVVLHIPYSRTDVDRFVEGVMLRARVRHTNLIPVYDTGLTDDGQPFFTEPFIQTTDLGTLLDDTDDEVSLHKLIVYLLNACNALNAIHAEGALHLDVCPGNVLIASRTDEVFLAGGEWKQPRPKMLACRVVGRLSYIAPEQADPELRGRATVATDVYGLGGILYFVLYRKSPNKGSSTNSVETLAELANRKGPPSPGHPQFTNSASRKLTEKLEPICLRALESDRTKRQDNVLDFSQELTKALR